MNTNMNSRIEELKQKLENSLKYRNEQEVIDSYAGALNLDIMFKLNEIMIEKEISKADLAKALGTSKSYITQLFSGEKFVNLNFLAKIEKTLKIGIEFNFRDINHHWNTFNEERNEYKSPELCVSIKNYEEFPIKNKVANLSKEEIKKLPEYSIANY